MKELVEYIACSLVDHPEEVQVVQHASAGKIHLELKVNQGRYGQSDW